MFRVKICGVRSIDDVLAAARSNADCIGLNFYRPSVRYVTESQACRLSESAESMTIVGVFVNEPIQEMIRIAKAVGLDWVQLHGDEAICVAEQLAAADVRVIRAVRLPTTPLVPELIDSMVQRWIDSGAKILLDADGGGQFGGSGQRLDWDGIGRWAQQTTATDWVLAGGLCPENVADAIMRSHARSVDVASGTERPKGTKDAERITQFVINAHSAMRR